METERYGAEKETYTDTETKTEAEAETETDTETQSEIDTDTETETVILIRSEMWVVTHCMIRNTGGLKHRMARHLTGKKYRQMPESGWEYSPPPPRGEEPRDARREGVGEYITQR